jgi:hypothetical protein
MRPAGGPAKRSQALLAPAPPSPSPPPRTRSGGKWHVQPVCEQDPPPGSTALSLGPQPYHRPANLTPPNPVAARVCHIGCYSSGALCTSTRHAARYRAPWRATMLGQHRRCSGTRARRPHAPDDCPSSPLHKGDAALSVCRLDALRGLKRFRKGCQARTVDESHKRRIRFDPGATHGGER